MSYLWFVRFYKSVSVLIRGHFIQMTYSQYNTMRDRLLHDFTPIVFGDCEFTDHPYLYVKCSKVYQTSLNFICWNLKLLYIKTVSPLNFAVLHFIEIESNEQGNESLTSPPACHFFISCVVTVTSSLVSPIHWYLFCQNNHVGEIWLEFLSRKKHFIFLFLNW